jgi:hypothetical protein
LDWYVTLVFLLEFPFHKFLAAPEFPKAGRLIRSQMAEKRREVV